MKNIIICVSCGSALIVASGEIRATQYVHMDILDNDTIITKAVDFIAAAQGPSGLIVIDVQQILKKQESPKQSPIAVLTLSAVVTREIEFELDDVDRLLRSLIPQKSNDLNQYPKHYLYQGKISQRKGVRREFHIKQPRSRSQYPYRRPVTNV